jgi:hypothetical protein
MHTVKRLVIPTFALAAIAVSACSHDTTSPSSQLAISLASAYSVVPAGFSELSSTFDASGTEGPIMPGFDDSGRGHGPGGPNRLGFGGPGSGPGFGLGLMGGGLGGPFFGDGFDRGDFHPDDSCAFAVATGLVTCGPTTHDGITVTRVSSYKTLAGVAQSKIDSATNAVSNTITVSGSTTRRDSSTSSVNETSTQTVTGLAAGSTSRTVNGRSSGTEQSTGTSKEGAFTASRTVGDTTTGVVIPVQTSRSVIMYPTAGTAIRSMSATVTIAGQTATTSSRREVITYDGSATAKVVITVDGTTQNCTLPLPHGRLACQ